MTNLVAILIVTNLVRIACTCGYCHGNIVVPEHVNSIGHDLKYVVSTNYLPVITVKEPMTNNESK